MTVELEPEATFAVSKHSWRGRKARVLTIIDGEAPEPPPRPQRATAALECRTPHHATPHHATPRYATPRHTTPQHAAPRRVVSPHFAPQHVRVHTLATSRTAVARLARARRLPRDAHAPRQHDQPLAALRRAGEPRAAGGGRRLRLHSQGGGQALLGLEHHAHLLRA
eukprot:5415608-Prymnesium_polylepis.1